MDYEKKYRDLVEAVKKLQEANPHDEGIQKWIEDNIPELKESEDERIRKKLIQYFSTFRLGTFAGIEPKKIIDWLEKQGEHGVSPLFTFDDVLAIQCAMAYAKFQDRELNVALKKLHDKVYDAYHDSINHNIESQDGLKGEQIPANSAKTCKDDNADKVEPKFKVGDWVVNELGDVWHIDSFDKKNYQVSNGNECNYFPISMQNEMHLWSIADAKDGDVLSNGKMIVIFKHFEEPSYRQHIVAYIGLDTNGDIQITDDTWDLGIDKAKPATKEQRDLLFSKMHEEGYEWLSGKKRLVKLLFKEGDTVRKKLDGSIWHINYINEHGYWGNHKPLFPIENQNEFELVEQKPAWSEEDERLYECLIEDQEEALDKVNNEKSGHSEIISDLVEMYRERIAWFKDLKDRVQPQPKQEWSEEGVEAMVKAYSDTLPMRGEFQSYHDALVHTFRQGIETALKSLRPQSQWKPSNEHIQGLIWVINRMPGIEKANEAEAVLRDLLEQLNKLK